MSIEEAIGEEDEETADAAASHEPKPPTESRTCCTIDPLYPAMTLGRRRCRKGHSIRRTGNRLQQRKLSDQPEPPAPCKNGDCNHNDTTAPNTESRIQSSSSVSSDDDLDKLLVCHNYDTESPLAGELLSYFDMKFCSKTTSLLDLERNDDDDDNFDALSNGSHPVHGRRTALSLDDLDQYTDHEDEDVFYSQDNILDILASESKKRTAAAVEFASVDSSLIGGGGGVDGHLKQRQDCSITNGLQTVSLDSDEGSISSGCETASTVTTTNMDEFAQSKSFNDKDDHSVCNGRDGSTMTTRSITMVSTKRSGKTTSSLRKSRNDDSDSEFSDESGYVEYQESKVLI